MPRVIAVTAASPRVGTTTLTVGLALALQRRGGTVCLLDADWGPAGAGVLLAQRPEKNLLDLVNDRARLEDVVQHDVHGIDVVLGHSSAERMASLSLEQLRKLATGLAGMAAYDYLVIDVAAGQGRGAASLLAASDDILMTITPDKHTQDDAFTLIERLQAGSTTGQPDVVVNRCRNPVVGRHSYNRLREITEFYLHRHLALAGIVCTDARLEKPGLEQAVQALVAATTCFSADMNRLADALHQRGQPRPSRSLSRFWQDCLATLGRESAVVADEPDSRLPDDPLDALETQLDTLSGQVERLISRVNQCRQGGLGPAGEAADTAGPSGRDAAYWLQNVNHRLEAGEQACFTIQQSSGRTIRCAFYRTH